MDVGEQPGSTNAETAGSLTTCDRTVVSWEDEFGEAGLDAGETVSGTYKINYDSHEIAAGIYWSFGSAREVDENTAESHAIFFDEIVIKRGGDE